MNKYIITKHGVSFVFQQVVVFIQHADFHDLNVAFVHEYDHHALTSFC